MSHKRTAVIFLMIVAAGYSLLSVAVRLMGQGFEPFTQVYMRLILGAVVGTALFYKRMRFSAIRSTSLKDWLVLVLMGVVGYSLMVYFITVGALEAKLINVSVIYATVVFFSYIYSVLFLKVKLQMNVLLLILLSFAGVTLIATKSVVPDFTSFGRGELYVFLSAVVGAWYYIGRKMLSDHLNITEISMLTMYIATLFTAFLALLSGEHIKWTAFMSWPVLLGLGIGGAFNIVSSFLENYAFKYLAAVTGSQILLLENVFALFFGFFLYKEVIGVPEIIGAFIVIGSVYAANKVVE